ncbi:MAG TPA: hypothetical protein VIB49_10505 [Thermoplasmata archaeon]
MAEDRTEEIRATFQRVRRPLQWPMEFYRRKRIANAAFAGYRFSRNRGKAIAGFSFGFALRTGTLPGVTEPPEVVAYAFVGPVGSALHRDLVARRGSAVRRLVAASGDMGFPYDFHAEGDVAAIRHRSLARLPPELFVLVASDFYMNASEPMRASGFLEAVRKATSRAGP